MAKLKLRKTHHDSMECVYPDICAYLKTTDGIRQCYLPDDSPNCAFLERYMPDRKIDGWEDVEK